ncbi:glycosyl hydrolase family 12 [Fusarium albosuccineum]|uniref:Glycosyl hydrolase family 12 n=1 Tax=Fusarium albosuccineum TaxID=1237068 RepID=A0A8H4KXG6_9HYPO|nr:glycosyl hydrolase family 12 [Fusarium albosuccineum]
MKSAIVAALAGLAAASPTGLFTRGQFCGQWDSETAGAYTIYNNLWGQDNADSGEQCTTNNGEQSDGSISWAVEWTWTGGQGQVKSYPNAVVEIEQKSLAEVSSISTAWDWSYTGDGVVANVAYDLFTGSTADGTEEYEFMIWLGALGGAGPISATGSAIATVELAGYSWQLYQGKNNQMTVFSFVAESSVESFCGDLADFTDYLVENQGVSDSQILQSVGAGTEPFEGTNAVFTTNNYHASVSY